MPKLRVLVVDDAVVVRRLVSDALNADPEIEVCGTASNGKLALELMLQVAPDAVTLDVEMPELDGLSTLRELRKKWPRLPVIMLSALTEKGASVTLDCLSAGASGYVTKPTGVGNMAAAKERVHSELAPMIKALCHRKLAAAAPAAGAPGTGAPRPTPTGPPRPHAPQPVLRTAEILAIGVSTGGPNALAELIPALPADLAVPVVIVQHMPPVFTRLLAERLASKSKVPVTEAMEGETLQPGHVYVAPGDFHMVLQRHGNDVRISLNQEPPENSCRPAVDPLFRSVSAIYGKRALGVVLTGMGRDGLRGCEVLREAGAQILAQDEETSVVWGMPGFVARAGLADEVIPLARVAAEIARRVVAKPIRLSGVHK
ncbi:MAG: chemotaxis response regulator protein-glutamate methylesterase [Planctomycetota bacterium]